ncbi:MAG: hypothetical protein FJX75_08450 [Armatimonadetes bacterium]|nr:hypothetical protein [Armatimonadota bacterium]
MMSDIEGIAQEQRDISDPDWGRGGGHPYGDPDTSVGCRKAVAVGGCIMLIPTIALAVVAWVVGGNKADGWICGALLSGFVAVVLFVWAYTGISIPGPTYWVNLKTGERKYWDDAPPKDQRL